MYMPLETIVSSNIEEEMPSQFPQASLNFGSNCLKLMFEEECLFPIPEHEVLRIQQGIEMMVFYLLTFLYEQTSFIDLVCSSRVLKKKLTSIQKPYRLYETFKEENLLKVGSYYEKSKIIYPDEFDYICLIADCDVDDYVTMKAVTFSMSDIFHKSLYEAIQQGLQFPVDNCLQFDGYVRQHGPAAMLNFRYGGLNESASCKSIFVDITPAIRVHIRNVLPKEITPPYPDWKKIICETGSFLIVKHYNSGHPKNKTKIEISVTESEQRFLQEMSKRHKCVHKLLKFIIKGHVPEEEIRQLIRHQANRPKRNGLSSYPPKIGCDLSSYALKTLMFHHCQQCERDNVATVKDCVNRILFHLRSLFKESLHEESSCSVLLSTMTGETIEVADSVACSSKIEEELNVPLIGINITELSSSQLKKKLCIANRLQDIVKRDTKNRGEKKAKRDIYRYFFLTMPVLLIMTALILFIVAYSTVNSETKHCFTGSEFTDGIVTAVTADSGRLTTYKRTSKNVSVHLLCLDHKQASKANKHYQHIYSCGYEQYKDTNYYVQKINDGLDQDFFCDAYRLHENDNLLENTSLVEFSVRIVSCVEGNITCHKEEKTQRFGYKIVKEETSDCYEEGSHQLQKYLEDKKLLECNISDSSRNAEYSRRGICCCSTHPCTSLDQQLNVNGALTFSFSIALASVAILTGIYVYVPWIKSSIKYRRQKRIISSKETP